MRRKRVRCDAQIADFQHGLGLAALSGMLPSDNACCLETRELLISLQSFQKFLNRPDANAVYAGRAVRAIRHGPETTSDKLRQCVHRLRSQGRDHSTPGMGRRRCRVPPVPGWALLGMTNNWPTALDAIERERGSRRTQRSQRTALRPPFFGDGSSPVFAACALFDKCIPKTIFAASRNHPPFLRDRRRSSP